MCRGRSANSRLKARRLTQPSAWREEPTHLPQYGGTTAATVDWYDEQGARCGDAAYTLHSAGQRRQPSVKPLFGATMARDLAALGSFLTWARAVEGLPVTPPRIPRERLARTQHRPSERLSKSLALVMFVSLDRVAQLAEQRTFTP